MGQVLKKKLLITKRIIKKGKLPTFFIKSRLKKVFLVFLLKLHQRRRLKFYLFFRKKKIINSLYKNLTKICKILKNKFYIKMHIFRKRKNVFLNFANIFSGNIYTTYSCGHYFKRSLRRTYFAIEALLMRSQLFNNRLLTNIGWVKKNLKTRVWVFLIIKGNYFKKGFKKLLREFISVKKNYYKIKQVSNLQFKAHNGIKKKSKRRK